MTGRPYARVRRDGDVAVVTMDRSPVNAVSHEWMLDLAAALAAPEVASASVVVLESALVKVFCAGADLEEQLDDDAYERRAATWRTLLDTLRHLPVPVVAAVRGACVGGGIGLVAQCDVRVATATATFSLPEIRVGRAGGASHLRRFVSEGRVRRFMLTGDPIDAATAADWGLVDEIVPESEWPDAPYALARRIAAHGRAALELMKGALDASERLGPAQGYAAEQETTRIMRDRGLAAGEEHGGHGGS